MRVNVTSYFRIVKIDRGLGGFTLTETAVPESYVTDFCLFEDGSVERWKRFDLTNWAYFMAFDGERPVGGATVASRTKEINLLFRRDDLATLWDIRVDDAYKGQGIGQTLFDMAVDWCRKQGLAQMNIECQNTNVPAVRFYHKQGAILSYINEYADYSVASRHEPDYRREVQLIWYLDL